MSKGKNTPVIIGGIAAGVVIVALSVAVVHLVSQDKGNEPTQESSESERRNVVITQENAEEVVESMLNESYTPAQASYYYTSMSTSWHFKTGDAISDDAYVENYKDNLFAVYFDVFLEDDESTPILQSPVIPVGAEMNRIALDTPLDAGTYECVMVYHLIDNDQNTLSTLRVGFTIYVEE